MAPSTIIIKPKLRAPASRPEQLVRPRLLELLGKFSDHKATLISAPAGYGKTTLLVQWQQAEGAELPFAWISLDEQDNDLVRMWKHIVEALREAKPEVDFGADVLVGLSAAGQKLVEAQLPMLINELAELPHRVVVVLDDYQVLTEGESHESMAFFVEHLPGNVHLVLASRTRPPLPLGRLRARGELNEINTRELAFTEEEATQLLNEKMRLGIGTGDLSVLFERTEGWPAAIYLAYLSLQRREDKHAFITSFGGSDQYIVDLLVEDVLAGLSEEVRKFLLRTSILSSMTGALCDTVVGREGSGKLLRELARSNLFMIQLGEEGEWYRYHHLFSDMLLYELKSSQPELIPVLHRRASEWSEGAGYFERAIRHAIAAADFERAGMLIARHSFAFMFAGQTATVERWLEALPEVSVGTDAALALVKAWSSALYGRREETERFLALAESIPHEGPLPDGTASVESGVALVRGVFGFGGVRAMAGAIHRVAESESKQISPRTLLACLGLGLSLYYNGDTSGARRPLEEGLRLARVDQPVIRIALLAALSFVAGDEGHLEEAESLALEARGLVEKFRLQAVPQSTLANIVLGRALAKRGKLAEAQVELENGLSPRRRLPGMNPWPTLLGLLALAEVRSARGDRAGGRAVLAEARAILEPFADDAGIFPELLERQERKLRARKPRQGQLDDELTERELVVLGLLDGELTTKQMAQSLYVATGTVRNQIKSIYRKLGVSSREEAVHEARARELI